MSRGAATQISREKAAELGRETIAILKAGGYRAASGAWIDISGPLAKAVRGTASYPPDNDVPAPPAGSMRTAISVENETTLSAARRLAADGSVAALNFASGTLPGGGFLSGARAQEESLARSSGLHACLADNPMYEFHKARRDAMYTDYVLYSPGVPVIRTDDGTLLDQPWLLSVITSPAVNRRALEEWAPGRIEEIRPAMSRRARKVLSVAAHHGQDRLVLGAWGCGAFGIDPALMAAVFHEQLTGPFECVFKTVAFAITDWSPEQQFIGPFRRQFEQ